MNSEKKANNLINEKSPYLLQHAYNPIEWYPWGEEAFEKAKKEDKPIFLSIGYSTCHWCHVMEHESFEDEEVASIMNKYFVAIKVDREERPDVDSVYMTVCQALTGHGGWPLTIIMTPEQKPFFAGTYYPKYSRYNLPGIIDVLTTVYKKWESDKKALISSSYNLLNQMKNYFSAKSSHSEISMENLDNGYNQLLKDFDSDYGGFGKAPKFPTPHKIMFLLRYYKLRDEDEALKMAEKTLISMYRGGIFDHIGYGFSRYSTDNKWLAPHFEKMLYDNALLVIAYFECYEVTKKNIYKDIAIKVLEYVIRVLKNDEGGFYCAEDADSEGEEGKYYLFSQDEIKRVLGEEEGEYFNKYFDITSKGNFEGENIPNLIKNNEYSSNNEKINEMRMKVLNYRNERYSLHKDDKILTSWNGLMLAALAKAYKVVGDDKYLEASKNVISFISKNLVDQEGRLYARYRDGEFKHKAYLDDYAFLSYGLVELYENTFEAEFLSKAVKLTDKMIRLFYDDENQGFYLYGNDSEELIARPKELYDGAMPSGNSVAAYNLIKLARITGKVEYEEMAYKQLNYIAGAIYSEEVNHSFFLCASVFALSKTKELICVVANKEEEAKVKDFLREKYYFNITVVIKNKENEKVLEELITYINEYRLSDTQSKYYLCEGGSCRQPVTNLNEIEEYL